ncbi:hypothetical protein OH687_17515 [Burkholderia anthina]|nr:hypothetical protein OH687_17515 [Burkholderia anthina]
MERKKRRARRAAASGASGARVAADDYSVTECGHGLPARRPGPLE